jgi:hypothetical protein
MEFKGTKGKWVIRPTSALNKSEKPLFYDLCIENQSFISTFKNETIGETDKTQLANAKLISCAPEMLEMLDLLTKVYSAENIEKAKLLIKKATTT